MALEHGSSTAEVACARCGDRSPAPGPFCGMCGARRTEPASPLPPSTNQLRCPHCGVLRTSTGRLCGSCGADTETVATPPSAPHQQTGAPPPQPTDVTSAPRPQQQPPPAPRPAAHSTDLSVTVQRAWTVAVGSLVLGMALGVGATLFISSSGGGGGSDPAQAAACARAAQLQKQADAGPPPVQGTGQFADPARSTSLYNATLSQLASQTALCHGH